MQVIVSSIPTSNTEKLDRYLAIGDSLARLKNRTEPIHTQMCRHDRRHGPFLQQGETNGHRRNELRSHRGEAGRI